MKSCRMVKIIKGGTHMKNTIYDYVDLRGDLSPIDFPYNEIDFLIFSELSYINLDEITFFCSASFRAQDEQTKSVFL